MKAILVLAALTLSVAAYSAPVSPKTAHCKIKKLDLQENAMEGMTNNRIYEVRLTCQENLEQLFHFPTGNNTDFESLNLVNYNAITSKLMPAAFEDQRTLAFGLTSAFSSAVITIKGVNVNFNDASTVIPALPRQQTILNPGQALYFSNSPLADLIAILQLKVSSNGYNLTGDAQNKVVEVDGETGLKQFTFFHDINGNVQNLIEFNGDLAKDVIQALQASGVKFQIWDHKTYSGDVHDELLNLMNDRVQNIESCRIRTIVATGVMTYGCKLISQKMEIK